MYIQTMDIARALQDGYEIVKDATHEGDAADFHAECGQDDLHMGATTSGDRQRPNREISSDVPLPEYMCHP